MQFSKFLIVGGLSALINIGSRILFSVYFSYIVAIVMAFFVALTTAFILNKLWVFDPSRHQSYVVEYLLFLFVNLIGLLQTVIISLLLLGYLFPLIDFDYFPETIAHSVGVGVPVFTSFIGHKYLSFRN